MLQVLQTVMAAATTTAAATSSTSASASTAADVAAIVDSTNDFYSTGRVGRRNALPDILSQHARTSTADLPDQLGALSTRDISTPGDGEAGCSSSSSSGGVSADAAASGGSKS